MNPIAVLWVLLGLALIVIAFRGKQDNLIATVTGKPYGSSTLK